MMQLFYAGRIVQIFNFQQFFPRATPSSVKASLFGLFIDDIMFFRHENET